MNVPNQSEHVRKHPMPMRCNAKHTESADANLAATDASFLPVPEVLPTTFLPTFV